MRLSHVRRALIILAAAGAVLAVALLLHQDRYTLQIRSGVMAGEAGHAGYVAALVGTGLSRGNTFEVLTGGEQIFPVMLEAIDAATRRITFETYIYDRGEVAERFTTAFERAAHRGVAVRIVVDAVGGAAMEREHRRRLEDAGVKVVWFNPPRWYRLEDVNFRTHRKILVVDGEVAFTGGVSVSDHWLPAGEDAEGWRDTQVRIRGPLVRGMEGAFYENFLLAGGPAPPVLDAEPPAAGEGGEALLVRSSSTGGANALKMLYLLSLASATHTIDIASPYFLADASAMWSLENAISRGVRIRLLLESEETDAMPVKYASRAAYDDLMALGIELYEYKPTLMHAKVMVVDGVWSMFGSANFDNRSLELNDELNVAVSDRALAERFLRDFEADLTRSELITPERWQQRRFIEKVRERFWVVFGETF